MTCPKCGSDKVTVTIEQTSAKTRKRGTGILWGIGRFFLVMCTGGLWLLVGKRKGTANTKFMNKTVSICQACGNKAYI